MKIVFWLSLGAILYTYALYPAIIYVLAKTRPKPFRQARLDATVTVILAVHNGRELLPRKIDRLLSLGYRNLREIIVVSDGSTDGTAEYLSSLRNPSICAVILPEHAGKGNALNAGMQRATSEIVLFVDLRPELGPGTLECMVGCFADPAVGCVAAELKLLEAGHDAVSAAVGGLYWSYEQRIRLWEAAYDSPVGVYGGCYAVRRELLRPQPSGIVLDDMFQPLSVIRQGYRSVFCVGAYVFDQWPKTARLEFSRKVRTMAGNFQLIRLAPWIVMPGNRVWFQLVSHKLLRLAVPYLLVLSLVSSMALARGSVFYAGFAALQACALLLAVIRLKFRVPFLDRIASASSALLVLNTAAVVGLFQFLSRGDALWKIWKPTAAPVHEHLPKAQTISASE